MKKKTIFFWKLLSCVDKLEMSIREFCTRNVDVDLLKKIVFNHLSEEDATKFIRDYNIHQPEMYNHPNASASERCAFSTINNDDSSSEITVNDCCTKSFFDNYIFEENGDDITDYALQLFFGVNKYSEVSDEKFAEFRQIVGN